MRYAMYAICYDALALALPLPENCKSGKAQTQSANAKRFCFWYAICDVCVIMLYNTHTT
jgi:hypothetical protein